MKASTVWTNICKKFKKRRNNMFTKNNSASTLTMPSDREIVMTRVFDAPRELIFKAYTDPDLIPKWWGLRRSTTIVDKMDVRPGGLWRISEDSSAGASNCMQAAHRE